MIFEKPVLQQANIGFVYYIDTDSYNLTAGTGDLQNFFGFDTSLTTDEEKEMLDIQF